MLGATLYSIRFASLRGSSTPFWSLVRSNPFADSARTVTDTFPARFAIAFHAENNSFRSAEKSISTNFSTGAPPEGDAPGTPLGRVDSSPGLPAVAPVGSVPAGVGVTVERGQQVSRGQGGAGALRP